MFAYPQGNVEDGQPDFGKSIKIGSIARSVLPNAETAGDRVPILVDTFGRVVISPDFGGAGMMVQGMLAHDAIDNANAGAGEFPVFIGGRARTATPTAVADGDVVRQYYDANGRSVGKDEAVHPGEDDTNNVLAVTTRPLPISTYSPLLVANFGAATDINVKAAAGNLFAIHGQNDNVAVRYMQLHNLAGAIGGGAVPLYSFPVPAGGGLVLGNDFWTIAGAHFSLGIRVGWSTTKGTYTAATATDHTTNVHYI